MTNEQYDAMLNEGIYPDDDDTHEAGCSCPECEPDADLDEEVSS